MSCPHGAQAPRGLSEDKVISLKVPNRNTKTCTYEKDAYEEPLTPHIKYNMVGGPSDVTKKNTQQVTDYRQPQKI